MAQIETRFGWIEYTPEEIVHFPEGLVGFEQLEHFVVMPREEDEPLVCLQSVDEGAFAFLLADVGHFFPSYTVRVAQAERQILGVGGDAPIVVLAMITVHGDDSITVNLAAPVLYAPDTKCAFQKVLETTEFSTRTPLPLHEDGEESETVPTTNS